MGNDAGTIDGLDRMQGMQASYVEVAVPVPLRRTFTYRVPAASPPIVPGARVVVPFGRRKLAGFVVSQTGAAPAGQPLKDIVAPLDTEPLFGEELLRFLTEAADYYMHPLGEVLRAAAPALPSDALRALRSQGLLEGDDAVKGSRIAVRRTWLVSLTRPPREAERLGPKQRQVLESLADGERSLDELGAQVKQARTVVQSLAARHLVSVREVERPADPFFATPASASPMPQLNAAQQHASAALIAALDDGGAFLLHGVTGSGKTEVYLRLIAAARERGGRALVLVPEIALTPQLVARFRARLGDRIAVLHSGLTDRERHEAWRSLRQGRVELAIGARSALFAPIERPAVIVVDEEHDPSFKQEEGFRYHARDMALLRAHRAGAVCVLGSATPSIESYHLTERGKLGLLELPERATPQPLPAVELVDLKRQSRGPSGHPLLTGPLIRGIEHCLERGEQCILFLNRRGYSPNVVCKGCGEVASCPACSIGLTEHRAAGRLVCHSCGFERPWTPRCPACKQELLEPLGVGTERLESSLEEAFPDARIGRLDRDTAGGRRVEEILQALRMGELDVLVGTQMVTKGHDVPNVTLVGVVLADQSLAFPDFRAAERTFQLLAQVAGRAGRGSEAGRVILQTYQVDHPAVRRAQRHDFHGFYRSELSARRELGYAPYSRMVMVRVDAGDESRARRVVQLLASVAQAQPEVRSGRVRILGPAQAPIARLRARYRFRFTLQAVERKALRRVAGVVAARIDEGLGPARAHVDIDPVAML